MNSRQTSGALALLLLPVLLLAISPATAESTINVGSVKMESEAGVPGVVGDVDDALEEEAATDTAKKARNFEPVVAPLPSRNSAFGCMLSVLAMLMYKPSFNQPEDRVAVRWQGCTIFLYPAFGQGADLRGYQMGSYRDQFLVAAQAEYRHRFTERIGAVAFAGVGSVSPDFSGWEKTLGSFGAVSAGWLHPRMASACASMSPAGESKPSIT